MCEPPVLSSRSNKPKHVVISGAGPGGVLVALNLLGRNDYEAPNGSGIQYKVTLVDDRQNYGDVSMEELSKHRSWMIGLSKHGVTAIRDVPGLYNEYVSQVGVQLKSFSLHLGAKEIKSTDNKDDSISDNYIVDRNYIVWALTNSLMDRYGDKKECFQPLFHTRGLFVDGSEKRLFVRGPDKSEYYVDYDILIGADGIRSVVRSAFVQHDRHFECKTSDIFARFKAVHVELPKSMDDASLHLLPNSLPNMNGIALPEKGNSINFSFGYYLHKECEEELKSSDPKVVADYFRKHFKAAELVDYDDLARQWTSQSWNSTGQVQCNKYHNDKLSAIIMGDAAHATSPSIGMGMNTALADAAALNRLLDEHKDDWDKVLPAFSQERVKEGRALSDLAYYLFSMKPSQALKNVIVGGIRNQLYKIIPSMVYPDPNTSLGVGEKLSVVYDQATKMGYLASVRATNDEIRRKWEEERLGMVTPVKTNGFPILSSIFIVALASAGFYARQNGVFQSFFC
eukprot:CAMPEP_0198296104 /NCGR_PEP_ID=MMETSP1449-20131203/30989_1 /TAXON_ID=420275 /ORGANISM="Attheya septentrionalis, Strain CCMP2084" /LENGTH=510 /DNA_ID=CAMNT_0043996615 /DNA_START=148 /DNA_END=1680 /DNA_ORIENTATION=-